MANDLKRKKGFGVRPAQQRRSVGQGPTKYRKIRVAEGVLYKNIRGAWAVFERKKFTLECFGSSERKANVVLLFVSVCG